jgi:hypothetical protein
MGAFTAAGMFPLSVEQLFEERMTIHRNLEEWRRLGRRGEGTAALGPRPNLRSKTCGASANRRRQMRGRKSSSSWDCVCGDIFSDNHDVNGVDGRLAGIGSFRGAGAFLDSTSREQEGWRGDDYSDDRLCGSDGASRLPSSVGAARP